LFDLTCTGTLVFPERLNESVTVNCAVYAPGLFGITIDGETPVNVDENSGGLSKMSAQE
jgi:hypothetical protein